MGQKLSLQNDSQILAFLEVFGIYITVYETFSLVSRPCPTGHTHPSWNGGNADPRAWKLGRSRESLILLPQG